MQLDWTTIALEALNFLVLVWLLKRFLYKPILAIVAKRQAAIEQQTKSANETEARARELETRYEARLRDWEKERGEALAQLQEELREERRHALAALDASLQQAREKARVLEERRAAEESARREREALEQGGRFVRRVLSGLASPELEAGLVRAAADEIEALPDERRSQLRTTLAGTKEPAVVSTAFALPDSLAARGVARENARRPVRVPLPRGCLAPRRRARERGPVGAALQSRRGARHLRGGRG